MENEKMATTETLSGVLKAIISKACGKGSRLIEPLEFPPSEITHVKASFNYGTEISQNVQREKLGELIRRDFKSFALHTPEPGSVESVDSIYIEGTPARLEAKARKAAPHYNVEVEGMPPEASDPLSHVVRLGDGADGRTAIEQYLATRKGPTAFKPRKRGGGGSRSRAG